MVARNPIGYANGGIRRPSGSQQRFERFRHDRLDDIGVEARGACALAHLAIRIAGEGDESCLVARGASHCLSQEARQLAAAELRQTKIDESKIGLLKPHVSQRFVGVGGGYREVPVRSDQLAQHLARVIVVFDDEHAMRCRSALVRAAHGRTITPRH